MGRRAPLIVMHKVSDINLTPLMDLTFILLITFIITFPLVEHGIPLDLPAGKPVPGTEEASTYEVSIGPDRQLYFENRPVSPLELEDALREVARGEPNVRVYVRADKAVDYGTVVGVLQSLQEASLHRIALVTRGDES